MNIFYLFPKFFRQKGRINLLLSSLFLILSFPKFNLFPLAWFAFVPLFLAIRNLSPRESFIFGLLSGFFAYLGLLYWISITITAAGEPLLLGILCLTLLSAYLALYFGVFTFCLRLFTINYPRSTIYDHFFPAVLWVSLEFIRSRLFSGFPWVLLGYSQWNFLPIIQISEFTGAYGVSFLIILVNTGLFRLWETRDSGWVKRIKIALPTFSIFLFCLFYGLFKLKPITNYPLRSREDEASPITCFLLQGNIDQYKKWSKEYEKEILDTYETLVRQVTRLSIPNPQSPFLIIWPESAIPGYLLDQPYLYQRVKKIIRESNCYHLIGSVRLRERDHRPFAAAQGETLTASTVSLYNSVFLFSPEGRILNEYDKIHTVPFGESIPLKDFLSRYIKVLNQMGDFSSGKNFTVFHLSLINLSTYQPTNAITFSTNICFEAIFPHLIRNFVKNGAGIIINLTNDAWFLRTAAPDQHFIANIFRAVENRRYVVRAANTGISAFIDPYGRIVKQTKIFVSAVLAGPAYHEKRMVFYTIYGDLFAFLCLFTALLFAITSFYRYLTNYGFYGIFKN